MSAKELPCCNDEVIKHLKLFLPVSINLDRQGLVVDIRILGIKQRRVVVTAAALFYSVYWSCNPVLTVQQSFRVINVPVKILTLSCLAADILKHIKTWLTVSLDKMGEDAYILPLASLIIKPQCGLYSVPQSVNAVLIIKKIQPSLKSSVKLEPDSIRKT